MNTQFFKKFILISLPIMLQAIATTAINLIDNIMVGQLGDIAIGGVSAANRFLMMFNYTLWGLIGASTIFIAQYYGAKKIDEMKQSFRFSVVASYLLFIPFAVAIIFFSHDIARFFVQDDQLVDVAHQYLSIMVIGYVPFVLTQNITGALKSIKEVKIPVIATITGVITNTALNYCLIFGNFNFPTLGVNGAAIATVVARLVEFLVVYYFYQTRKYEFNTKWYHLFKIELFRAKTIFYKAIPLMINEFAYGAGLSILLKLYATRGTVALAAYSIAGTSTDIFYSALQAFMVAITVMVGHELGKNELEIAKKNGYNCIKSIAIIGVAFSFLLMIIAPIFPNIYNISQTISTDTLQLSLMMIYLIAVTLWSWYIAIGNYMLLRVGGDMKSTLLLDGIYMWVVNISLVASLTYFTDLNILYLMMAGYTTDIIKMIVSFYFVKKGNWIRNLAV